ncbi:D-lactate dehydrogenase [Altererythrobacter xiamenensis]|uniref:D-lactate dehydrogenase n=1 Tax=Altererythrobacter xiamenensis TaxID=1316679 RepID=A0A1Y6F7G3_9SPHN|nr:D-lactate dehydrogenase [Altererythrobacter xiamenensis]SMQ69491.1 D-lactate dehydrogenase [Altererythrobacter xiamenensis]
MVRKLRGKAQPLAESRSRLIEELRDAVDKGEVLTDANEKRPYSSGYRVGAGVAVAVVRPGTLLELWFVAQVCVRHDTIIILQAANTGLTGGSTPFGEYDRPVVVISTLLLEGVLLLEDHTDVICLAGSTLTGLAKAIEPSGRLPHSVIGSSCLGASVVGGVCNNSGGALVRRGPAFTRHALFARIDEGGTLRLVNHLGRDLGSSPETILENLDAGDAGIANHEEVEERCDDYLVQLRQSDDTPARYNADPRRLFEASGSAGKLIVFAVRVPTYPAPRTEQSFLVTTDKAGQLADLRQAILSDLSTVPSVCEYLDRNARELAAKYGRDVCHLLAIFGPEAMPTIQRIQRRLDVSARRLGSGRNVSARLSQAVSRITPHPLTPALRAVLNTHEHALLLTTDDEGIDELDELLLRACKDQPMEYTMLGAKQAKAAFHLRFASAGATVRMQELSHLPTELSSLDIALPRNTADWQFILPERLESQILAKAVYGHFLCHVFHLDFLLRPGVNKDSFESEVKAVVEERGGQMPAEHNFGHLYEAPPEVAEFYRALDPTNALNPGIGKTSRRRGWA